ncbi:MarR family transcriptional regulator [Serinibacter arcticus]|uniref:MarR family transcriptional regulator n=1 Tax=Serinibacter arcticus TaxID=1655435 RepID=A0A2U1ZR25_9MICO|nr:MarR family transcriptional regulator [Serinibacter arcticus]PWD49454.1 MarR family transcriptional regulator [Serinibacter arcticus]
MTSRAAATRAWSELLRTSTLLMRRYETQGDFGDLAPREYDVLLSLAESDGDEARLGQLAQSSSLPQPSMSRIVERLERRELVSRCPTPDDGRGVLVRLTDAGRAVQRDVARRHVRSITEAMSAGLDDAEVRTLAALLRKVRAANSTGPSTTTDATTKDAR